VQPEAYGTPLPARTPINFAGRKAALTESNRLAMRKLTIAVLVSFLFVILQITGGIFAKSIAIFTDSAHLASDMFGFAISILSLKCSQKPATSDMSYGYHRAEIVGTVVSILTIWILTIWLLYEATLRVITPQPVVGGVMLVVAIMGLFFNIIQMKVLDVDNDHSAPATPGAQRKAAV
jgi:zinc transporter 2